MVGKGAKGMLNGAVPSEATKKDQNLTRGNWGNQIESLHVPLLHHADLLRDSSLLHGAFLRPVCKPGLPGGLADQPHVQRRGLWYDGGVHIHWHLLQRGHLHRLLLLLLVHDARAALGVLQQPLEHT
uniref:Solute carrier family 6 (neurotransmitter transporter, glycine), member 9 n=1 Tax=Mus musculus TaxID=10090 RepID=E9PWC4_MOUSE